MKFERNTIVVIVGSTAVGKTSLSVKLAHYFKTEILSADARQFFKETNIATAKPSESEMAGIKHHFINSLSITEDHNAGRFEQESMELLDSLFKDFNPVIVVGGSGLYIKALCEGMDKMPEIPDGLREQIKKEYASNGIQHLQKRIAKLDPDHAEYLDIQNPQRLIRAIEVCLASGLPYSTFRNRAQASRPFDSIKIGLERPRDELYNRIDMRMDAMIEAGLFDEAQSLADQQHLNALQTVGYSEIFPYLRGEYDKEEAVRLLKRNSRRFAKRQMTWFKKDEEIVWFHPEEYQGIVEAIEKH